VQSENNAQETTGIGINNVKRRLALLYPNKHSLDIDNSGDLFTVKLQITLL
jgi:LytS/YehU family sensor histidine kinase